MSRTSVAHLIAERQLCVIALCATTSTSLLAAFYPYGPSISESTSDSSLIGFAWVVSQSFWLVFPGLLLGIGCLRFSQRIGALLGNSWALAVVLVVLCDCIAFNWISERFLSRAVLSAFTNLPAQLAAHVPPSTWAFLLCAFTGFSFFASVSVRFSRRWAKAVSDEEHSAHRSWLFASAGIATVLAAPSICNLQTTKGEMYANSARHPFCAFLLVKSATVGGDNEIMPRPGGVTARMEEILRQREHRQKVVTVHNQDETSGEQSLPDVVLVVIESMRPELVDPEVMPALAECASKGLHCQRHFSSGNSTNHGLFSLLNGLDATWYPRALRQQPILNRVLQDAGYEIGFFAGHNDWAKFRMDGFINRKHFDRFRIESPDGLASDRRATQRAADFLSEDRDVGTPRMAILYLYSTHATYASYPQDQVFQPAADNRFLIPFGQAEAPGVWNRYKNSARSVDRFVSAVLHSDRVVLVTGDHGESFLEDGVCGHGTRISQFQNMTPWVLHAPNVSPTTITTPTSHIDVVPTLLSTLGIQTTDPEVLDGIDCLNADSSSLSDHIVLTRNYLTEDCALISADRSATSPFAQRARISLVEWNARSLNWIDPKGNEFLGNMPDNGDWLPRWVANRFGDAAVASLPDSPIGH